MMTRNESGHLSSVKEEFFAERWREKARSEQGKPFEPRTDAHFDLSAFRKSEWSDHFEQLMRARLIFGAMRYGKLGAPGKLHWNNVGGICDRLEAYEKTHNTELLVDIANLALIEFVEGDHPDRHWETVDDGDHVQES
jgi:hypothetical protein